MEEVSLEGLLSTGDDKAWEMDDQEFNDILKTLEFIQELEEEESVAKLSEVESFPTASSTQPVAAPVTEWTAFPISLLDPLFGCPITLAGVGANCQHWQPICLLLHLRYAITIGCATGGAYVCPLIGCQAPISFDWVIIFQDLPRPRGYCKDEPAASGDGDDNDLVVMLDQQPRVIFASLQPNQSKRDAPSLCPPPPTSVSFKAEEIPTLFTPCGVEDDMTCDIANLSEKFLRQQQKQQDLEAAAMHDVWHWRTLYCQAREQLKKARRRSLRTQEQLISLQHENSVMTKQLQLCVTAAERLDTSAEFIRSPTTAPAASSTSSCISSSQCASTQQKSSDEQFARLIADSRKAATTKLTQLRSTLAREETTKRHVGGLMASLDRQLLVPLWDVFVKNLEDLKKTPFLEKLDTVASNP